MKIQKDGILISPNDIKQVSERIEEEYTEAFQLLAKGEPDNVPKPVDIGSWKPYQSYTNKDQISLQRKSLYYTGLCNGLGDVCFIFTSELATLNEKIEEMSTSIKIKDTETVVEDEVYYTTKIEGAKTTRARTSEIHNGAPLDKSNEFSERMVKNSFAATKLLNLYSGKMTETLLLTVWKILTDRACDNEDIAGTKEYPYRSGDVAVGLYEAPSYTRVGELMKQWIAFYNSKKLDEIPFVKAALMHFVFETIHPFCDGNGRMGRLLTNNYLISRGIESAKAVSFSMQIDARRIHYDAAFVDAENIYNDCTPFLQFTLEAMYSAYETALDLCIHEEEKNF